MLAAVNGENPANVEEEEERYYRKLSRLFLVAGLKLYPRWISVQTKAIALMTLDATVDSKALSTAVVTAAPLFPI